MNLYTVLQKLCRIPSISGREEGVRACLAELIAPYADEVKTDNLGNLIAVKRGTAPAETKKKLMLCAHMDEIGFLVTFIEDNGMIRIAPVGGINFVANAFGYVISEKGVRGVLVPEGKTKPADYATDKFFVDIGAKSRKDAERKVRIGEFFVAEGNLHKLAGSRVAGRPLDDRIGCAVLLETAEQIANKELSCDVYYVFSVQEEVGCRGSMTSAFAVAPDYSLCFDVTGTGDIPGAGAMACGIGKGAAVKLKDNSVICNEEVVTALCALAEEKKIAYQREILLYGGTDTSSMQLMGTGSRAGALSIPSRYIHSGVEVCDLNDAKCCADLAVAFAETL